jgi:hypothetical protein
MKSFLVIFFALLENAIFAQVPSDQQSDKKLDYEQVQTQYSTLSCGSVSDSVLAATRRKLESVDTAAFAKNIHLYYRDLGWCYYIYYGKTADISYIGRATTCYKKALFHEPKYSSCLFDLALFNYIIYKDCIKGKEYLERYKRSITRRYWDKEEFKHMENSCQKTSKL